MKDSIGFLMSVWSEQCEDGDFVFLAVKRANGEWKDFGFTFSKATHFKRKLDEWFNKYPSKGNDLYFCPLPFSRKQRLKEYAKQTKFLWQDLDYANPQYIQESLKPSVAWQSSPGRFQGLWELDTHYEAVDVEMINRTLAHTIGADKGGWDLTQVLRIPGTHNNKYKEKPTVTFLYREQRVYSRDQLQSILKTEASKQEDGEWGETADRKALVELDPKGILKKYYKKLPRKALTMLLAKSPTMGKRSDIIWYLENKLHEIGLNPHEIFTLIKNSVWNKYVGRHDEDERLKVELEKIIEGKVPDESDRKPDKRENGTNKQASENNEETDASEDDDPFSLRVESYSDVMGNISSHPGWLVEGWWLRRSHGIVAGEPKSFKSTYVIDLAMSVASGEPFLGKFPVLEQGPVLYIQNENADWIIKDKMEKVIANRGLGGEVKIVGKRNRKLNVSFPRDVPIYFINQQGFLINDPIHQEIIEKFITQVKPVLIVFDPLYLMFDGDINSAKELNPALNWLLHIKNEYKVGVILIHHYNKGGGGGNNSGRGGQRMLGSVTLHGWIESAWYLKHPESKEDEDDSDVTKPSGKPTPMILDREFRAAGGFPKVELLLTMGDTGDPLYNVEINKVASAKKSIELDEDMLADEIMNLVELSNKPVSQRKISDETGASRRMIKKVLDQLAEQGRINITVDGVLRINRDKVS